MKNIKWISVMLIILSIIITFLILILDKQESIKKENYYSSYTQQEVI